MKCCVRQDIACGIKIVKIVKPKGEQHLLYKMTMTRRIDKGLGLNPLVQRPGINLSTFRYVVYFGWLEVAVFAWRRTCQVIVAFFATHFFNLLEMSPSVCCIGLSFLSRAMAPTLSPCFSTSLVSHSCSLWLCCRGRFLSSCFSSSAACASSCETMSFSASRLGRLARESSSGRSFSGSLRGLSWVSSSSGLITLMILPVAGSLTT